VASSSEKPIHLAPGALEASGNDILLRWAGCREHNEHMPDHVYKKIEIVGSSPNGFEEAVRNALTRAQKTVRNMRWFEVTETRGCIEEEGKVGDWQVTLKIGFTLEE
jgi:dodecin